MDPPSSLGYVALGAGEVFFYTNNDTQSTTISGPVGTRISLYDLNPNVDRSDTTYVRGLNVIASVKDGQATYYHYNAHGDVVQLTDSTGALVKNYEYDAFGVEENAAEGDTNPFRYCGEQFDAETGNYYLRARYYTPGAGRFTQEDPIRDGLNWYAYCAGNPVVFVDPSGLEWGALRDFVTDVEEILIPPDFAHDPYIFSGSGTDGRVTVQVGDGYDRRTGTFYFDGRVEFRIHRGNDTEVVEGIAQNVNGHLYMERTDFYRAMGIDYVDATVRYTVSEAEVKVKDFVVGAFAAAAAGHIEGETSSYIIGYALGEWGMSFFEEAGEYKGHAIYAEIYNPAAGNYRTMATKEKYVWTCEAEQPGYWKQTYGPVTNFNGYRFDSVVDYLKTHPYER